MYLVITHSANRHDVTLTSVTHNAGSPKVQSATANAGIIAITTFHMHRLMLPPEWMWGESDIVSLFMIILSYGVPVSQVLSYQGADDLPGMSMCSIRIQDSSKRRFATYRPIVLHRLGASVDKVQDPSGIR